MLQKGFTLIELMIVVAIVAILAAIAMPAYQNYVIRTKVTEGISAAIPVKTAVAEGFESNGMAGLASVGGQYPTGNVFTSSKYVREINVDSNDGHLNIVLRANAANGMPTTLDGSSITLTPNISITANTFVLPTPGAVGAVDWACASATTTTAVGRGMTAAPPTQPLPAMYAPTECR
jgi:type IV pilus assembly protein PilA